MEIAFELVAYALGAVLFTALGLVAEFNGLNRLLGGDLALGVWLGFIGLLLLYAGVYLLGYERLIARLRSSA
jgi:hypothetical protein